MTEINIQKGYVVYGTDGDRVVHYKDPIFASLDKKRADQEARGGFCTVDEITVLLIDDQAYLLKTPLPVQLDVNLHKVRKAKIAAAKAKLTHEELELLGIKE